MTYLTRNQVRSVDKLAMDTLGIPGIALMENAGRGASEIIQKLVLPQLSVKPALAKISILCGGGNNGGDGYVIARHLYNRHHDVTLYAVKPIAELTGDALINAKVCQNMHLPIIPLNSESQLTAAQDALNKSHVIVDALLGTGFTGSVRSPYSEIIQTINLLENASVVAIDAPSGLDIDAGQPSNATIIAQHTVSFVAPKVGFKQPTSHPFVGHLHVVSIGVPPELINQAQNTAP